ncbi:hypothetical protein DICSQDRAFT_73186, partial [Dichomitus squalens LYAD-421 SS1]
MVSRTPAASFSLPKVPSSNPSLPKAGPSTSCRFCGRLGHPEDQCRAKRYASVRATQCAAQRSHCCPNKTRTQQAASQSSQCDQDPPQEFAVSAGCAAALLSSSERDSWLSTPAATSWNTDTGASAHMTLLEFATPHRHWFRSYSPHNVPIRLANSHIVYSAGLGSVVFQPASRGGVLPPAVVLHDVLHVPAL